MSRAKRALDIAGSTGGLALLSPLFGIVAIAIKLDDGGPVFFRQERVGREGEPFAMWKFRTMIPDAERVGRRLTVSGDPRITRVGGWLRRWKLDELPQLLNVLRGEMSLVGPRPEVPHYVALYTEDQRRVLRLTPGMTDPASIEYRNEQELLAKVQDAERFYRERIMPEKIRLNLAYADRAGVASDVAVILRTLLAPFRSRDPASVPPGAPYRG